jgi:hypothetical protein
MMDPNAPMTVRDFVYAAWAIALGFLVPYVILVPLWWWLDRRDHRRFWAQFERERQERQRQWAEERRRWDQRQHEQQRLAQLRDQLWLESLPEPERQRILARRRQERDRDQRAQALLEAERQAPRDGHPPSPPPEEQQP